MSQRLSRSAPYQVYDLNIHSVNDVFRQIQIAIDELNGLSGAFALHSEIVFDDAQFGAAIDLQNVAATESLGTSELLVRADHRHAHGSGYLPDAHHNKSHVHLSDGSGTVDHGSLSGNTDDDHLQYLLASDATSRALFATNWLDLTDLGATALHSHAASGIDHNSLANLTVGDVHTQYRLEAADHSHQTTGLQAGKIDHGLALDGLADDDHPQYAEQKTPAFVEGAETQSNWEIVLHGLQEFLYSFKDSVIHLLGQNRFRYLNSAVSVFRSTNQSINDSTFTAISFDSESFDTDGLHEAVTNPTRITIALTGKYFVSGVAFWDGSVLGSRFLVVRKNGAATDLFTAGMAGNATGFPHQVNGLLSLVAGDYIELFAWQNTGAPLNVTASGESVNFQSCYVGE